MSQTPSDWLLMLEGLHFQSIDPSALRATPVLPEIHKNALGCFRPKEACAITTRSYRSSEHQVEGEGLRDVILGVRSFYSIFSQLLPQLCGTELIETAQNIPDNLHIRLSYCPHPLTILLLGLP